ncbi:MAG: S-adenosyl-L-methionine-dependent methyltransferase [Piptocephalis tieghemiana]|nr:MAG: S-adenosyl-L-methionine-dependent methyltransferase [Piptocephalis tieghemiana]
MDPNGRQYHRVPSVPYPFPADLIEMDRLEQIHHRLKEQLQGALHVTPVPEWGFQRILDVGCGSGAWSLEMATSHPHAQVMGIDLVPVFPGATVPRNCSFELVNLLSPSPLPFPDASFDLIYQRLLTLAIPETRYASHLRELYRISRPGASLEIVECDLLFRQVGPHGAQLNAWIEETVSHQGLRRDLPLPIIMYQTGWHCTHRQTLPHHADLADDMPLSLSGLSGTLSWLYGMRQDILRVCGVDQTEFDQHCQAFLDDELIQYGSHLEFELVVAYRDEVSPSLSDPTPSSTLSSSS